MDGQKGWKRTLLALWMAQAASMAGFAFSFPFMPGYLRELGVADDGAVSIWAGVIGSAAAVTMALFAPFWGSLADRHGRKIMVERSMFGAALCLALMSTATSPWHLLAVRFLQGALSGTISASIALVAAVAPERRAGFSMGFLQTGSFVGASLGQVLGGVAAEIWGFRSCFFVGAALLAAGGVLVMALAREERQDAVRLSAAGSGQGDLRGVLATTGFLGLLAVITVTNLCRQAPGPIFLLFVEGVLPPGARESAPSVTGLLLGLGGVAAALAAVGFGWVSDRVRPTILLAVLSVLGGLFFVGHALAGALLPLAMLRLGTGAATGGMDVSLNRLVHRIVPRRSHGKAFGFTQSATSVGFALGPSAGGFLGAALGFPMVFLLLGFAQILVGAYMGIRWLRGITAPPLPENPHDRRPGGPGGIMEGAAPPPGRPPSRPDPCDDSR